MGKHVDMSMFFFDFGGWVDVLFRFSMAFCIYCASTTQGGGLRHLGICGDGRGSPGATG